MQAELATLEEAFVLAPRFFKFFVESTIGIATSTLTLVA